MSSFRPVTLQLHATGVAGSFHSASKKDPSQKKSAFRWVVLETGCRQHERRTTARTSSVLDGFVLESGDVSPNPVSADGLEFGR